MMAKLTRYVTIMIWLGFSRYPTTSKVVIPKPECFSSQGDIRRPERCRFYSVVFDAGSTGTRVHIFMFNYDQEHVESGRLKVVSEAVLKTHTDTGLSYYAGDPSESYESLSPLIRFAKHLIPSNHRKYTPLALQATAGVRILRWEDAHNLIQKVNEFLVPLQFHTNDETRVATVMSGLDEATNGWISLNHLLGRLDSLIPSTTWNGAQNQSINDRSVASLDLGGASTQIAFKPKSTEGLPRGDLVTVPIYGRDRVEIYAKSYMGNGMRRARLGILTGTPPSEITSSTGITNPTFHTPCLPSNMSFSWNVDKNVFTTVGSSEYGFEACAATVKKFVKSARIYQPPGLNNREIFAYSHYYKVPRKAQLITDLQSTIRVGDFKRHASVACARGPIDIDLDDKWSRWLCLDLVYLHTMLTVGYGLEEGKEVTVLKKVGNHEVSWAYGAAYQQLDQFLRSSRASANVLSAVF